MSGPHLAKVLEPMTIRGRQFRNRMVKTPQDMNFADFEDGTITQNYLDFYGSLAAGGVGGIIVEQSIVDAEGWREGTIGVFDDRCIPGLTRLAEVVHQQGCPIILQINHLGPRSLGRVTHSWLPVGKRVVIVGGGIQGCETAEFLVKRGRQVTIVEATDRVGMEIVMLQRILLLPWLEKKGTKILSEVTYDRVTDKGMVVTGKDGVQRTIEADTIIVTIPLKPNQKLVESLKGAAPEVHVLGDCKQPGLIIDAIADGYVTGSSV